MANLLEQGSEWLNEKMRNHASSTVIYKRGSQDLEILAEFGKTKFSVSDANGVLSDIFSSDFMFDVSEFLLGGQRIIPERFDEIIVGTKTYEVYPFERDQAYIYCDPFEHRIRVHARERVA